MTKTLYENTPPVQDISGTLSNDGFAEDVKTEDDYLNITRSAYELSTNYMSSNLRRQWEKNRSNYSSIHPAGSKYYTSDYKSRWRLFRPKTRGAARQTEAAAVAAFFSTLENIDLDPSNQNDMFQYHAAFLQKALLGHRLKKDINWFKTLIGALQDAYTYGIVISKQCWKYEEETLEVVIGMDDDGKDVTYDVTVPKVDRPDVRIIPPENFRIHQGADWLDPVNSSPFTIEIIPMYVYEVKAAMEAADLKTGRPKFKKFSEARIKAAAKAQAFDSTRLKREHPREDPKEEDYQYSDHSIVWVYENHMICNGEMMVWFTLGVEEMLTDPIPREEMYITGRSPYRLGNLVIETHRNYPVSMVQLGQELQAATNDNFNQRFDNVALVLNKRHLVRRTAAVNLRSLQRSSPGGLIPVDDVNGDVKELDTRDVTGSAFAEQDRLNADFDEIMGSFSQGSVNTNRNLGETVGGMGMLKGNANLMTEYTLMVFNETWVKPVLRDILELERHYETNVELLRKLAGEQSVPGNIDLYDLLMGDVELNVNVGFGSTDPTQKVQRLMYALGSVVQMGPKTAQRIKDDEVIKEVFGAVGYQNGSRFFKSEQEIQQEQPEGPPPEVQLEMEKLNLQRERNQADAQIKMLGIQSNHEIGMSRIAIEHGKTLHQIQKDIGESQFQQEMDSVKLGTDVEKVKIENRKIDVSLLQLLKEKEDQQIVREEHEIKRRQGTGV